MQTEIDGIARQYLQLRDSSGLDAIAWALSLNTTELLAQSNSKFELDIDTSRIIPFLPMIFKPHEPSKYVTALELPYRVIISPIRPAFWNHSKKPVEHNGRIELWHTRLTGGMANYGRDVETKLRAIWSPDYLETDFDPITHPPRPFPMSLDAYERKRARDEYDGI